jgi:hypothetical protein
VAHSVGKLRLSENKDLLAEALLNVATSMKLMHRSIENTVTTDFCIQLRMHPLLYGDFYDL